MRVPTAFLVGFLALVSFIGVLRAQRPFKQYPAIEYVDFPLPKDYQRNAEWVRARLKYPDIYGYPAHPIFFRGNQPLGYWTMDYPRSDRHLLEGVKRLTRIDTRSVEQVVELDGSDDIYNWPMLYAVEPGHWKLPDDQAKQLREFIQRGGFFMCDDFHGDELWPDENFPGRTLNEWDSFMNSMRKVFPDREVEEIPDSDPIFHTLYDLDERFQVPGSSNYFAY